MATLLLVPACSQQVAALGSDVVSVQDQKFLNVIEQSTLAEIALFEDEAQRGQNPSVRSFARNLLPTAKEHLSAVEDHKANMASK